MALVDTRKMTTICPPMMCGSHLQRHHERLQRGPHKCVVGLVWLLGGIRILVGSVTATGRVTDDDDSWLEAQSSDSDFDEDSE